MDPFSPDLDRFRYDLSAHDFPRAILAGLREGGFLERSDVALDRLHEALAPALLRYINAKDFTRLTPYFFDLFEQGHAIAGVLRRFVEGVVKPRLGLDRVVYQRMPAVRFIFPEQPSLIPHKDEFGSFHADYMNGHPAREVNFWIPFTPCFDTNSLWVVDRATSEQLIASFETRWLAEHGATFADSLRDPAKHVTLYGALGREALPRAHPFVGTPGDVLSFTPRNVHGVRFNRTGATRVSLDFRVISEPDYRALEGDGASLAGQRRYRLGDLYDIA